MGNCQKASLILAWCCVRTLAVIVEHHPVLEGSSTTLVCAGNASGDSKSLYWQAKEQKIPQYDVAQCQISTSDCYSHNEVKYAPEMFSSGGKFRSQLTINNLTLSDKDTVLICSVLGTFSTWQSWRLTQFLVIPKSPTCQAHTNDHRVVNISCHTPRVYPELKCEVAIDGKDVPMDTIKIFESNLSYYSATCSILVEETPPGVRSFKVTMFPGFRVVENTNATVVMDTNKVNISSDPYIKLTIPKPKTCTEANIVAMCSAFWFPAAPNVSLYLDNTSITAIRTVNTSFLVDNTKYGKFVWTYQVSKSSFTYRRNLKCVAVYSEGNSNTSKLFIDENDSLHKYYSHPTPPVFKYNDGLELQENKVIVDSNKHIVISCEAVEMSPQDTSTTITCQTLSAKKIFNSSGPSVMVNVSLQESEEWYCVCLAEDKSWCYRKGTNLTVYTSNRHRLLQGDEHTNEDRIFIIFSAWISILVVIMVVALLIYYRKYIAVKCRHVVHRKSRSHPEYKFSQRNYRKTSTKLIWCKGKQTDLVDQKPGVSGSLTNRRVTKEMVDIRHDVNVSTADEQRRVHIITPDVWQNAIVNTPDVWQNAIVNTPDVRHGHLNTATPLKPSSICDTEENIFHTDTHRTIKLENRRHSEEISPKTGVIDDCESSPPPLPHRIKPAASLNMITSTNTLVTSEQSGHPLQDTIPSWRPSPKPCRANIYNQDGRFSRRMPESPVQKPPWETLREPLSNSSASQKDRQDAHGCNTPGSDIVIYSDCANTYVPEIPPRSPIVSLDISYAEENR